MVFLYRFRALASPLAHNTSLYARFTCDFLRFRLARPLSGHLAFFCQHSLRETKPLTLFRVSNLSPEKVHWIRRVRLVWFVLTCAWFFDFFSWGNISNLRAPVSRGFDRYWNTKLFTCTVPRVTVLSQDQGQVACLLRTAQSCACLNTVHFCYVREVSRP